MTVQIKLRAKYRRVKSSSYRGGSNNQTAKKRHKINAKERAVLEEKYGKPPKIIKVVDGKTGKSHYLREKAS